MSDAVDEEGRNIPYSVDEFFINIMSEEKAFTSSDVQVMFREEYETRFNLLNHDDPRQSSGWPLLRHLPLEDSWKGSLGQTRIRQFINLGINSYTGQSLNEFLSMPREWVEEVIRACQDKAKSKNKDLNDALNGLNPGS